MGERRVCAEQDVRDMVDEIGGPMRACLLACLLATNQRNKNRKRDIRM